MCNSRLSNKQIGHVNEVALAWQFFTLVFLGVLLQNILFQPNLVPIHKEYFIFNQRSHVLHNIMIMQKDFIVDKGVQNLLELLVMEQRFSLIGRLLVLDSIRFRVIFLHFVEEIFLYDLENFEEFVH